MGDRMPPTLDLFAMVSGLFGGLAFLLYGMERMADSLKQVAGDRMRGVLVKLTGNRLRGLFTGVVVTAIIQSSSVTTVLVVGFVSAGVMSLPQSLGIILGADIGTTITAQIIAFNVTRYGLLLVAAGFGLTFIVRQNGLRLYGALLMGIGLVFYGMSLMSEAMSPLRAHPFFMQLMEMIENPLLAVALGAVFTALVHASAATIGLTIVLASQDLITLETGIALSLGANIGTCVTAGIAAIGKSRPAIQAALAHVLFKVIGTLIVLPFISQLALVVACITPLEDGVHPSDLAMASPVPRQIANAHTLFNVGLAILFLPLTTPFARFLEWLVPCTAGCQEEENGEPLYLDPSLLQVPSLALGQVRLEAGHMGQLLLRMLDEGFLGIYSIDREQMDRVRRMDDSVDRLYTHMADYLARMSHHEMTEDQSRAVLKAMSAIGNLESVGDIIETNLHHLVDNAAERGISMGDEEIHHIEQFRAHIRKALELAVEAFSRNDPSVARQVYALKGTIDRLDYEYKVNHINRMREANEEQRARYTLEVSVVEYLKRIYYHSRRTAKRVIETVAVSST